MITKKQVSQINNIDNAQHENKENNHEELTKEKFMSILEQVSAPEDDEKNKKK